MRKKMTKNQQIKAYCFECSKEQEVIVETIIKTSLETKYTGKCKCCNGYLCRVIFRA